MEQLCWKCKRTAANCPWLHNPVDYVAGSTVDSDGFICSCPLFIRNPKTFTKKELAEAMGISVRQYYRNQAKKEGIIQ